MNYGGRRNDPPPQRSGPSSKPNVNPNIRCPKCGAGMIKRTAKFHKESDSPFFWGCSNYPNCKTTRIYQPEDEQPVVAPPVVQKQPEAPKVVEQPKVVLPPIERPEFDMNIPGLITGSPEQEAIWQFMRTGTEHGQINAVAGSGKSFTIVQGGMRLKGAKLRILVVAFNKHIEKEMNGKLQDAGVTWMTAKTTHSLGKTGIKAAFPHAKLDKFKLTKIIKEFVGKEEPKPVSTGVKKLVQLCKNYVFDGRDQNQLLDLAYHHGIDLDVDNTQRILDLVPIVLQECLRRTATYDFDDMIWWTVVLKLPVDQCDMLLVDEAQDTNKVTQELLFLACPNGRIFVVGDTFQAIYGFRGADTKAMNNLFDRLNATNRKCQKFPLTVTRRCPKSHVRLAQAIVPHIRAMDDAPEGIIESVTELKAVTMMKPADLVLCRTNAPLVPICYGLLKRGIKAQIKGKDIGEGLINFINSFEADSIPDLLAKVVAYEEKEIQKLAALEEKGEAAIEALQDKCDTVAAFCEGKSSIPNVISHIESIFSDFEEDGSMKEAVVLGTVHRTKGLESHNVYVLKPELIPHPAARLDWQVEQERNLAYVAVTRSKYDLKTGEDGRIVFMGPIPSIYNYHLPEVA